MTSSAYINSLGWTLIHSIWQLTLLAVIFYFIMVALKDRKPGYRYRISLLFMVISVSVTSLTFILMYRKFAAVPDPVTALTMVPFWFPEQSVVTTVTWWQSILNFLQANVTSLTYMYMVGVGMLLARMGINFWSLHRIKAHSSVIGVDRLDFLEGLIKQMNLPRNVSIRSSVRVQMPMVIGAFQPVVLIPLSLLTNTSPHILKAVISHELAHVERHDFLINIVQTVVETLFFYHPAVWYFSYMTRREREFCCDQRAVEAGCQREDLARALSEIGEMQKSHTLSMALGGKSNDLLDRIKYLLGFKPSLRYVPDHSIWYYGSLLGLFLLFSIGKNQFFPEIQNPEQKLPAIFITDTIPQDPQRVGHVVTIKKRDSMVLPGKATFIPNRHSAGQMHEDGDTVISIVRSDTIPGNNKTIIVQSNGHMKVIIEGEDTIVVNGNKMRIMRDSLRLLGLRIRENMADHHFLDSLQSQLKQGRHAYASAMRLSRAHLDSIRVNLDSIHLNLSGLRADADAFKMYLPDSFPHFAFTIPSPPAMDMDSLWDHLNIKGNFKNGFGLDSLFTHGAFSISSDSLFFDFNGPLMNGKYADVQVRSRELQELSKEIRAKERELHELRREQQQKYRQELQEMKKEQQKQREEMQKEMRNQGIDE